MGGTWLPDPSIGTSFSDDISIPSVVMIDSDNEDADIIDNDLVRGIVNYSEYHLLTDGDNMPDWEENNNSDSEDNEDVQIISNPNPSNPTPDCDDDVPEPVEIVHRDITVDCDQVRAAMSRVTLPPSATPSWAASIPDSEWCTYLQNRIRSMQEQPDKFKESATSSK